MENSQSKLDLSTEISGVKNNLRKALRTKYSHEDHAVTIKQPENGNVKFSCTYSVYSLLTSYNIPLGIYFTKGYPLLGFILGVLTHTIA